MPPEKKPAAQAVVPEFAGRTEKAFSFAQEFSKQLLTLSTGIFTLTLTFLKDVAPKGAHGRIFLEVGWGFFLASILFGILVLGALAGNIERPHKGPGNDSIYSPVIKALSLLQMGAFFGGLVLAMIFGVKAL